MISPDEFYQEELKDLADIELSNMYNELEAQDEQSRYDRCAARKAGVD